MRHLFVIFIMAFASLSIGQTFNPKINKESDSIMGFVPLDWIIRDSISGIIGQKQVYVIIIQHRDTMTLKNKDDVKIRLGRNFQRVLVVAVRDSGGKRFDLLVQNNRFIPIMIVPTMIDGQFHVPETYEKMLIQKDILQIKFQVDFGLLLECSYQYNFKFCNNQFTLIEADVACLNGRTFDSGKTSYNFLAKKGIDIMNLFDKGKSETKEFDVMVPELRTLDNMQEFMTWKVAPDKFL